MDDMRTQAERFGAELVPRDVTEVDLTVDPKIVKVGDEVHRAHAVIVATGSKYRYLGLENEARLLGRGVSACATCDGFFFRDQDIVVVGGGDSAMEEATFLTRFAKTRHRRPPASRAAGVEDHAAARAGQREDPLGAGQAGHRGARREHRLRRSSSPTSRPARPRPCP